MRTLILAALVLCARSLSAEPGVGFSIERNFDRIVVSGDVSSTAHEAILRQTAVRLFVDEDVDFDVRGPVTAPPGWALVTDMALRAVALTRQSRVTVTADRLVIAGVTDSGAAWSDALARVRASLPGDMLLVDAVVNIRVDHTHAELCRRRFHGMIDGQAIGFLRSGVALKTGSYATLDALVEIAIDCPRTAITVTGHTDDSGNEAANRQLSLQRADAVAEYLQERGLPAARITTRGAGSSEPLVANVDSRSRQRNRRVEIVLKPL